MSNIVFNFKKKRKKKIIIITSVGSLIIGLFLTMFFLLNGPQQVQEKHKILKLYQQLFVNKNPNYGKDFLSKTASKIYDDILKQYHSNKLDFPQYHATNNIKHVSQGVKNIYQIEDSQFKKGQNIFKNWGNRVIFIVQNHLVTSIQYRKVVNYDNQFNY